VVGRLGARCARHRWIVVILWIALLGGVISAATIAGGHANATFTVPGTGAQTGADIANRAFPEGKGLTGQVVVEGAPGQIEQDDTKKVMEKTIKDLATLPHMSAVTSPYGPGGEISADKSTAIIGLTYNLGVNDVTPLTWDHLQDAMQPVADLPGIHVSYAGTPAAEEESTSQDISEGLGILAAIIILLVTFGTVLAMASPLVSALSGLVLGLMTVQLAANVLSISSIAPILATMIGLGVGIDYAVFIVNRQRESLQEGMTVEEAIPLALGSAGRAVLVAGLTVSIALLGLVAAGIPTVTMLGVTASIAVLTAILAALTLLPAILAIVGQRIVRKRDRNLPRKAPTAGADQIATGVWGRWARLVGSHPIPFLLLAVVILAILTIPLFSMQLGQVDAGSDPKGSPTRIAYDTLAAKFGPGFNGPIEVVLDPYADEAGAKKAAEAIGKDKDVATVTPPQINAKQKVTLITVIPKTAPTDDATQTLVSRLPAEVQKVTGPGVNVYATGVTAGLLALSDRIAERLPWFIAAVILLSFILLLIEFKSVFVPLKAAVMNVLSIGAAYGVIVAIFEWGWGASYIGVPETVQIESYVPMMMFAILFGLSMDYEVFLISRIREEHLRGAKTLESVEIGLSYTARVITAAALIMITVFLAFVLMDNVVVKMFGIGLATAVLVDATIVRLMLVPSTMVLLGEANWWLPGFLRRILPKDEPV
jgi:putative drug exporter of the RND superfamily